MNYSSGYATASPFFNLATVNNTLSPHFGKLTKMCPLWDTVTQLTLLH
ncbi:MAG: hypothetical protein AB7P56_02830 [Nitrososphaeraceae archaeon]